MVWPLSNKLPPSQVLQLPLGENVSFTPIIPRLATNFNARTHLRTMLAHWQLSGHREVLLCIYSFTRALATSALSPDTGEAFAGAHHLYSPPLPTTLHLSAYPHFDAVHIRNCTPDCTLMESTTRCTHRLCGARCESGSLSLSLGLLPRVPLRVEAPLVQWRRAVVLRKPINLYRD